MITIITIIIIIIGWREHVVINTAV